MKTMIKGFWIIGLLVLFAFTACEGPVGPAGPGGLPGQSAITVVDAEGREIGMVVDVNANIVMKENYTFQINIFTAKIDGGGANLFATGENGTGILFYGSNNVIKFPNYIFANGLDETIYRPKNRNSDGFPTDMEIRTAQSTRSYAADNWTSSTASGNTVEVEEIFLTQEQIIGFTPTPPLRFVW